MKAQPIDSSTLEIDPFALDRECIRQPRLFFAAAEIVAQKRAYADEAKSGMDLVAADLDARIRAKPEKFGIEKVTEGAINKSIQATDEYIDARKAHAKARYEADVAQALVTALEHKKSMLGHLVALQGQNYFSDVRPPTTAGKSYLDETKHERAVNRTRTLGRK